MKHLFWIIWSMELIFMLWLLIDEMINIKYMAMPNYIPLGFLWLALTLFVKLGLKHDTAALVMVGIPGVPLLIMLVFLAIVAIISIFSGPIRWN